MWQKVKNKILEYTVSAYSKNTNRDPRLWVFGEWYGNRANDNSCFLLNYIVECVKNNKLKLIWIADRDADLHLIDEKVTIIQRDSESAKKILLSAGVTVVNEDINDFSSQRLNYVRGSISVDLWHGIAWKHIFYDDNNYSRLKRPIAYLDSHFNNAKYWVAPSSDMKDILTKANFVKPENIITTGYPRNSYFYNKDKLSQLRDRLVNKIGASDTSKIIAYMPTFRDSGDEIFSFDSLAEDKEFSSWLEDNDVYIVQKAHFVNEKKYHLSGIQAGQINNRIINDNDIAAFELMGASDMLVTDYSSCFFDYLILDRPIVHFIYDYEKYVHQDRGVYYTVDEVCCGDAVKNVNDLKTALSANIANPNKDKELRRQRRERFINYENDHSCEDIYQFIISKVKVKYGVDLS